MNHKVIPATKPGARSLVTLHGSGGNENELLPLAGELLPGAAVLGLRGTVEIDGGFAFFHRRPDRSLDEADIDARIPPIADFIASAGKASIAVGFSNGAIMAAALLLTHPRLLAGAILLRPLSPFLEDRPTRLDGVPVLIIDGAKDSRRSPGDGARLAERLTRAGATVTHHVLPGGHSLTVDDTRIAQDWLAALG